MHKSDKINEQIRSETENSISDKKVICIQQLRIEEIEQWALPRASYSRVSERMQVDRVNSRFPSIKLHGVFQFQPCLSLHKHTIMKNYHLKVVKRLEKKVRTGKTLLCTRGIDLITLNFSLLDGNIIK